MKQHILTHLKSFTEKLREYNIHISDLSDMPDVLDEYLPQIDLNEFSFDVTINDKSYNLDFNCSHATDDYTFIGFILYYYTDDETPDHQEVRTFDDEISNIKEVVDFINAR